MIQVVLDVNVLVSGFPAERGAPAELIERWLAREFHLVLSEHILDGVARAWANAYYRTRYQGDEPRQALDLLRARATMVMPVSTVRGIAADDEDDLVLATAVAGSAAYLVTGDRRLREVASYERVTILTPREFLAQLIDAESDDHSAP